MLCRPAVAGGRLQVVRSSPVFVFLSVPEVTQPRVQAAVVYRWLFGNVQAAGMVASRLNCPYQSLLASELTVAKIGDVKLQS